MKYKAAIDRIEFLGIKPLKPGQQTLYNMVVQKQNKKDDEVFHVPMSSYDSGIRVEKILQRNKSLD